MRAIDADALQLAIVEEGQANKRKKYIIGDIWELTGAEIREVINSQPTIQPEIIHCKDCRKHNKKLGFDENCNLTYKDDACPLIPWRGMSKGHEHDYQSCCFGERREVTT